MNVLLCHNHYQQAGGEDQSFDDEARLLESRGHRVIRYTVHNDAIKEMGKLEVIRRTLWNRQVHDELRQLIRREKPQVMHCTNTFPLISPAAYAAAHEEGVAVVQSLRNYRLLCANALLSRNDKPCEDCIGAPFAWPALVHKCYRDDRAATAVVTLLVRGHRMLGTWEKAVDLYFTPSQFARRKFVESGFPGDRIAVKPNFVFPDPEAGDGSNGGAIFVGRLSHEKGVQTLLNAWVNHDPGMPLTIVGDGPMAEDVKRAVASATKSKITWLGRLPIKQALDQIGQAGVLICPSIAYETFGRTVVEAFAKATPAICSDSGALAELISPGRTGLIFRAGDASDLAAKVRQLADDPQTLSRMRNPARRQYLHHYNAQANHDMLIEIYRRAIAIRTGKPYEAPSPPPRRADAVAFPDTALAPGSPIDLADRLARARGAAFMRMLRWLPRFREAVRAQNKLKERESWSRAQIDAWQLERVNQLWAGAVVNVPYYEELKRSHGLPGEFGSLAEFCATVPLLPKSVLRERSSELLSRRALAGMWKYSSGTTGRPAGAYWAHSSHHESLQSKYRFYADWGVDVFDRTVFLWGPGTSPMNNWRAAWSRFRQPYLDRLRNRLRVSACDLSKPRLREYLQRMQAFRPVMLYGYSRALFLLAMEAEAMGGFRCPSLKVIVASSEPAWPHMIETIERAFGAPVAREYGALECGIVATDSSGDRKLHVREDQVMVETLPRDDGQYDIVNTILTNPSFPLIRYVIGDRTDRPIEKPERGFAILNSVAGRNNDFLRTRSGDYLHWVHIELGIAKTVQKIIRRFSMHQLRDGSLQIDVELDDPKRDSSEALRQLQQFFEEKLEGYPVRVSVVDQVEQTAAGKHLLVRSDLNDVPTSAREPALSHS